MLTVAIYIKDIYTSKYNRVDLFDDEKISVTSSIQNINDISKTYTDFSQTFTVPASKQNNKIFRHWYDNSNDSPFSTLVKSDAYIEIDTILFRKGKIQLESANVVNSQPQDYSITFIGILGNLKDTFAGKFLKDLTSTAYDITYNANEVLSRVVDGMASRDIMFPLISSNRVWNVNPSTFNANAVNWPAAPIRYNELFPALRLKSILNMIQSEFGITFNGNFLTDNRFLNAYLYLKNSETFPPILGYEIWYFSIIDNNGNNPNDPTLLAGYPKSAYYWTINTTNWTFKTSYIPDRPLTKLSMTFVCNSSGSGTFDMILYNVTDNVEVTRRTLGATQSSSFITLLSNKSLENFNDKVLQLRIIGNDTVTIRSTSFITLAWEYNGGTRITVSLSLAFNQIFDNNYLYEGPLYVKNYMPEIKIEDFFSGLLKMFNLTCYSSDGINYTVEQLENYYGAGSDVDITKYVFQDKKNLNRVKTYKKINFDYEKSQSFVNVAFNSKAGIEYGSLQYTSNPPAEGEEYSIKLPFEDLNFSQIWGTFQVGYSLKTDYKVYIPKPIILYDYNSVTTTDAGLTFYTSGSTSGNGDPRTQYKAFGQETLAYGTTYGLNFNTQESTLTNVTIENGLYQQYYSAYFANIYNYKARLVKVSAILPTSILTSLKLNDNVIIRDTKYLINTFTTDLTTGEVQFELLTDQRQ